MSGKGSKRRPEDKSRFDRGWDAIFNKKPEGFCYCAIGAGGKPCVSREFCDEHGNERFRQNAEKRRKVTVCGECGSDEIDEDPYGRQCRACDSKYNFRQEPR